MYQTMRLLDDKRIKSLFYRVYGWMFLALLLTGVIAYSLTTTAMVFVVASPPLFLLIVLVELGVASLFTYVLPRLSYGIALALFITYALLSGVTLSVIICRYELMSIISSLLITSGMFGMAALYGYVTDLDLSRLRSILGMALCGLIISVLVNGLLLRSSGFDFMISCMGVAIFSILTAYDTYKIKRYALSIGYNEPEAYAKVALRGAFELYLDFVNLFLYLLRLSGKRKH